MKIYVVLQTDEGYLNYGREIGNGSIVESVHESLEDAWFHLQGKCNGLRDIPELVHQSVVGVYEWFNEENEHMYLFEIYEMELD